MEKKITKLSNTELENNLKNNRTIVGVFIGLMIAMIMIGIFEYINTKKFNPIFISAIAMIFFIIYLSRNGKKIKNELDLRNKNKVN